MYKAKKKEILERSEYYGRNDIRNSVKCVKVINEIIQPHYSFAKMLLSVTLYLIIPCGIAWYIMTPTQTETSSLESCIGFMSVIIGAYALAYAADAKSQSDKSMKQLLDLFPLQEADNAGDQDDEHEYKTL